MNNTGQKVIIFYLIQGRHKNCCAIDQSQSYYKNQKDLRLNWLLYIFFEAPVGEEACPRICNEQSIISDIYDAVFKQTVFYVFGQNKKRTR